MELSITQASKTWNIPRARIYEKINSGAMSRLSNGKIEPAEMLRVFGKPRTDEKQKSVEKNDVSENIETAILKKRIEFLEQQKKQYKKDLKHEMSRVDKLYKMHSKLLDIYLNTITPKI
jgi:DNA polymerase III delta prime subunit